MIRCLPWFASLSFAVGFASSVVAQEKPKRPPNVIVIYADDLGYADLGCFGAKKIKTPNLDRMAKQGVRFTSFYVSQAVCSASRAALMTGKYSNRAGILGALGPASKTGLAREHTTMAEMLKALGYATSIIGKWHLGHLPDYLPTRRGFDEYYGLPYSNDMWPKHPTTKFPDLPLIAGEKTIELNPDQTKLTTNYADKAVQFIQKNKDQPFFLYLAHNMPHVPLFVSERFKGKSEAGTYGDVIMEIDWSVGQILDTLQRLGIDDNTLVIFTSDNGPWLSYGNHSGSAGILREGKGTAWEGGVRVPFIARPSYLGAPVRLRSAIELAREGATGGIRRSPSRPGSVGPRTRRSRARADPALEHLGQQRGSALGQDCVGWTASWDSTRAQSRFRRPVGDLGLSWLLAVHATASK